MSVATVPGQRVYCHAVLGRGGLGNRLFPWARATIYARQHGARLLQPQWGQVKLGPLLRGERDKRFYHDLFLPTAGAVHGLQRAAVLATARRQPEPPAARTVPAVGRPTVVQFVGNEPFFQPLAGHHELCRQELEAITRPQWGERARAGGTPDVALHVRRGDFGPLMTPISWYAETTTFLRDLAPRTLDVAIVSDGTDAELAPLLDLGVRRVETGSSLGDLLFLSKAQVIVGTGASTFSAWAGFLGQSVTLHWPQFDYLNLPGAVDAYVGPLDPAIAPPGVREQLLAALERDPADAGG